MDEAELRLHPLPRPTDGEVETLAATVARRTLALLRARGVLEEEAAPDGALDVLQLEGIQVPRSGPVLPLAGGGAAVPSLRASPSMPTPGSTRTTSRASIGCATTAPGGPCRSSGSRLCPTDGSPTGGGSAGTTRGRTRALGAKTPK